MLYDYVAETTKAARKLAQQLADGEFDHHDGAKEAAEQRLSLYIEAGDISREEVRMLSVERDAAA